jgi:hypothetical protein
MIFLNCGASTSPKLFLLAFARPHHLFHPSTRRSFTKRTIDRSSRQASGRRLINLHQGTTHWRPNYLDPLPFSYLLTLHLPWRSPISLSYQAKLFRSTTILLSAHVSSSMDLDLLISLSYQLCVPILTYQYRASCTHPAADGSSLP